MPTYDYVCDNGHSFEEFQSMAEAPLRTCPVCGAGATRIISGGSGLIFKGSGFYITDYVKNSRGKHHDSGSSDNPAPSKSDSTVKTESQETTAKPKTGTNAS